MTIEEKHAAAQDIIRILDNPPDARVITDPDTILADFVQESDMEVTGIARDLITAWQKSTDKPGFEGLFELLTGRKFSEYLAAAVSNSTPPTA